MSILLTFHSHEGQTTQIAQRIADSLRGLGFEVLLAEVGVAPGPRGHEALVVGDSIRFERHNRKVTRYLRRHRDEVDDIPVGMFQVSMTSAGTDPARVAKAQELMQKLVDGGGVQPDLLAMFAGAIKYSQYGWVMKRVMRSIARREGNDTDMTRDHEYTDWDAVDRFARDVAALVQTRRPVGSPPVGAT
jgi:menaquinone-dependent protoporphyrinogen oxidase